MPCDLQLTTALIVAVLDPCRGPLAVARGDPPDHHARAVTVVNYQDEILVAVIQMSAVQAFDTFVDTVMVIENGLQIKNNAEAINKAEAIHSFGTSADSISTEFDVDRPAQHTIIPVQRFDATLSDVVATLWTAAGVSSLLEKHSARLTSYSLHLPWRPVAFFYLNVVYSCISAGHRFRTRTPHVPVADKCLGSSEALHAIVRSGETRFVTSRLLCIRVSWGQGRTRVRRWKRVGGVRPGYVRSRSMIHPNTGSYGAGFRKDTALGAGGGGGLRKAGSAMG